MTFLLFVGLTALSAGLLGLLGKVWTRSGGSVEVGSVYQQAWPLFIRWAWQLLVVGVISMAAAGILAVAS